MTKRAAIIFASFVVIILISLLVVAKLQWYSTEDYRLKIPDNLHISADGENLCLFQNEELVGGVTHYTESISYDDLIVLLQGAEEWKSYSLESDSLADKRLSFISADGEEYHHYLYRDLDRGIYDLWLNSEEISDVAEAEIVGQFELIA